jgi:imidazolonepropionase-like amidohydrolase
MKRSFLFALAALFLGTANAQDLAITNARIIDGTGSVINRGMVLIGDGRILSVSSANDDVIRVPIIDAQGMTLLPGFIDTHRHDLTENLASAVSDADLARVLESEAPRNLRRLLEEGFTTIMLTAFDAASSIEARRRLRDGVLEGPRILTAGPAFTAPGDHPATSVCRGNKFCATHLAYEVSDPAIARALVRDLSHAGVDAIKAVVDRQIVPGIRLDDTVLAAIIDEAHSQGLPAMVHAETVEDMLTAARLGADRLVHTPNDALIAESNGADLLRRLDISVATTVSFSSPQWAEVSGAAPQDARHQRILRNIEHLLDNGVIVAFGTDSPPGIRPIVELEQLATVLSPTRIIMALTRNAAMFLDLSDEIGTVEPNKIADLVLVDGDPLSDIRALANVELVLQAGEIVVDKR